MGADLTANSHEGEQIPALVLDPIPDLGIQILWHLFEASTKGEPLSLSDAWEKVGGEVSPFLSAAHELYQRGLIVSHLFLLRLTHEGRMALLSLVCAGKCRKLYNFAGCAQAVASVPGELALTAEKTSGYAPVGLAGIHIVKPHEPEKCEC